MDRQSRHPNERRITKVLVTGSSGFIGSALVTTLLAKGHSVLGLDIREPPLEDHSKVWRQIDIMDELQLHKVFESFQPTHCVHLAACKDPRLEDPPNGFAINTLGTEHVINACRATLSLDIALFASTILVCQIGYIPKNATDHNPTTPYGKSKAMNEELLRRSVAEDDFRWCIIRPTSIWGPGDNGPYMRFFRAIQKGWFFHPGRLDNRVTYGYIGNCVYQIEKIMSSDPRKVHAQVFYLGDYWQTSLKEWESMICHELGKSDVPVLPHCLLRMAARCGDLLRWMGWKDVPFNSFRLHNMSTDRSYDMTNTRELAGELPFSQLHGVRETIHWMDEL